MSVFIETKEFIFTKRKNDENRGDFGGDWCFGVVFFSEKASSETNKKTSRRNDGRML